MTRGKSAENYPVQKKVEKSVKLSSRNIKPVEIISQALVSKPLIRSRSLNVCGNKGVSASRQSEGDLSDICDAEVAGYLNNKKEFLLKKIAWEIMNPDYQKGKQRKPNPVKRKDLINKTALTKKTYTAGTESNAESENKKRLSSEINYDVLDKLFDDAENSPKRSRLQKPIVLDDQMENSQLSNEKRYLKPQCSEEEEEPDWNEDHSNEDAYGGDEEFEDQNEEDNEGIIW